MRILGIDPGTGILGFGVVEVDDMRTGSFTMIDAGVVRTAPHTPHDERLEDIFKSLTEIIETNKPDVCCNDGSRGAGRSYTCRTLARHAYI